MIYSRILQVNQAWVRAGDRLLAVFKSRRASARYGPVNFVNRCTKAFQFDAQRRDQAILAGRKPVDGGIMFGLAYGEKHCAIVCVSKTRAPRRIKPYLLCTNLGV
jgi:hypothetical protein